MMKKIFTAIAIMMSSISFAQTAYDISTDEKNGSTVFKGLITFADLEKESSFDWLKKNQAFYQPDAATLTFIQANLRRYNITVFMGTWCEDSQFLVPQLYKLLTDIHYPLSQYTMYGVDRKKTSKHNEQLAYNIEKVPTIILFREGKEVGRITELVKKSIDSDLAEIIRSDK